MKENTLAFFSLLLFGAFFGAITAAACDHDCASRPSTVVYDDGGRCVYWAYDDAPENRNPCGEYDAYVPENAKGVWYDE